MADPGEKKSPNVHRNTPADFVALLHELGPVALDPFSNPWSVVRARVEWWGRDRWRRHRAAVGVRRVDALAQDWHRVAGDGLIFVQPPYGDEIAACLAKTQAEADRGCEIVALLPARTDTRWWHAMRPAARCFVKGRLVFGAFGVPMPAGAKFPSAVLYWGRRAGLFARIFGAIGKVDQVGQAEPGPVRCPAVLSPHGARTRALACEHNLDELEGHDGPHKAGRVTWGAGRIVNGATRMLVSLIDRRDVAPEGTRPGARRVPAGARGSSSSGRRRRRELDEKCPSCRAKPGAPCRSSTGRERIKTHEIRGPHATDDAAAVDLPREPRRVRLPIAGQENVDALRGVAPLARRRGGAVPAGRGGGAAAAPGIRGAPPRTARRVPLLRGAAVQGVRGELGAAGAYLRVSSKAQDLAMQRHAVERAARARGDRELAWYSEKRSGATTARPELERVRQAAREGRLRRLYVFRLDRLTRSGIRDTLEVVEELRRCGCELVTVSDGFDLTGPAAEVVLAVLAWAAKLERQAINERIAAARQHVEARGGAWGRPPRVPSDSPLRERIKRMRGRKRTVREISVALKIPRSTVGRIVQGLES